MEKLLDVENLTVDFDGFKALDRMSLHLEPTSVRVLIGPNSAGKSTPCDAIIGRVQSVSGKVCFKGENITSMPEYQIVRKGICRKFQIPGVLENLTLEENLALSSRNRKEFWRSFGKKIESSARMRAEETLELTGLKEKRRQLAGELSHGQKQWLEIRMVLASNADLLLLDEPAAGMLHGESEQTAELIRRLSLRHRFLVIDHDMTFVAQLEAPVTVMHMGRLLKEETLEEARSDPQVAAVYMGRAKEGDHACA